MGTYVAAGVAAAVAVAAGGRPWVVEDLDAALRVAVGPLVEAEGDALSDAVLGHAVAQAVAAEGGAQSWTQLRL